MYRVAQTGEHMIEGDRQPLQGIAGGYHGQARIQILEDGERRARRAYDDEQTRYHAGLEDVTSVLSAEQTWRADRTQLTSERVQALRRAVQTYKARGGGWESQPIQTAARAP